jgi:hypothetical protein
MTANHTLHATGRRTDGSSQELRRMVQRHKTHTVEFVREHNWQLFVVSIQGQPCEVGYCQLAPRRYGEILPRTSNAVLGH